MQDYNLYGVRSDLIDNIWSKVRPYLFHSIQFNDGIFTIDDIYKAIKANEMQLYIIYKNMDIHCAVITEVKIYPRDKCLNILFLGGENMNEWIYLIEDLKKLAKENGCDSVYVFGRDGWSKILNPFGFKKSHVVLKADL